jgi:hypothetical protein
VLPADQAALACALFRHSLTAIGPKLPPNLRDCAKAIQARASMPAAGWSQPWRTIALLSSDGKAAPAMEAATG